MEELLGIHGHYKKYPDYQEVTPDVLDMVLTECAKFCETEQILSDRRISLIDAPFPSSYMAFIL